MVGLQVRSTLERSHTKQELIEDHSERPIVACIAELSHVTESLGSKVFFSAHERIHARSLRAHIDLAVIFESHATQQIILSFELSYFCLDVFIEYLTCGEVYQLDMVAIVEHDIARLQVPVDNLILT